MKKNWTSLWTNLRKTSLLGLCFGGLLGGVLGVNMTSPAYAEQGLRWTTPKIEVASPSSQTPASQTPAQTAESVRTSALHQKLNAQLANSPNMIQQVRYSPQQTLSPQQTPIPVGRPSQEAVLDTYNRGARPQYPPQQGGFSAPTPHRNNNNLSLQNDLDKELKAADDLKLGDLTGGDDATLREPREKKGIEIICPDSGILKPIKDITYDIRIKDSDVKPKECGLGGEDTFPTRDWGRICFMWKASALCHKPLYFEEEALERYGHTLVQEEFQPFISGARFFLTIPILPYKMGLNPPNECIYTLGHYRPGDCAPYMIDPLPLSLRAGLIEAGAIVGGIAIFP